MWTDLSASPVGTLIPITGYDKRFDEHYAVTAYLPHPLPMEASFDRQTWMAVTGAQQELGRLDAAASIIPNPHLIARLATRREAVGTSALEGTYANLAEVFAAEVFPDDDQAVGVPPNVREVMNYLRAAEMAYGWISDRPITLGMLSHLQAEIVRGTESDGEDVGAIRATQVFIGATHRRVAEARFVPPPPGDQLVSGCDQWADWLTHSQVVEDMPLVARIAMAHYQFEALHPYTDGNGRIGRLVAVLQMLREGALRSPVLSISSWLTDRADVYRDHLLAVSQSGDWNPWIQFFAAAVTEECRAGHDRIMRLLQLKDEIAETVRTEMPRARLALEIADDLIAFPILTVSQAQRRHGRSNQANRNAIGDLMDLGVLEQYGAKRYDRMYWNPRVFQIIE